MLSDEVLQTLIRRAQGGDEAARERILSENLNLVRSIVHRFNYGVYEWDDLFQLGCIGLIKAVERFDLQFSVKFSTYAVPMIIGEIRRFMRDDNPIKVSRPLKDAAYKIHRVQEKLQKTLGRDPTVAEISEHVALAPQEIVAALDASRPIVSIYEATTNSSGDQLLLLDQLQGSTAQEACCLDRLALKETLDKLSEKERKVILMRFYEDKTQAEIAGKIGLSQVQVSRIEKQALRRMRAYF